MKPVRIALPLVIVASLGACADLQPPAYSSAPRVVARIEYGATASSETSSAPRWTLQATPPRVDDGVIQKIRDGMTRDEVSSIVGAPNRTAVFALSRNESWDYDYVDAWGYKAQFSVAFGDAGRVVGTTHVRYVGG